MTEVRRSTRRRTAFTLIELLVVMALILVIFGLGIGYVAFSRDNQRSVTGAQAVSGAVLNAKGRARRDGRPTGVRLLFNNNPTASQLQFIQQPEDYNAGWCQSDPTPGPTNDPLKVLFGGQVDFLGGAATNGEVDEATVQPGDYFMVVGSGTVHLITAVNVPTNPFTGSLELASPAGAIAPGTAYTIIRAPRKLPSEDLISLPANLAIDLASSKNLPIPTGQATTKNAEIVFAPSGGVVGQGTGANKILLWLRDPTQPAATGGAPLLVSIQIRTGSIGVFNVAPGANPYRDANDPRSSGL